MQPESAFPDGVKDLLLQDFNPPDGSRTVHDHQLYVLNADNTISSPVQLPIAASYVGGYTYIGSGIESQFLESGAHRPVWRDGFLYNAITSVAPDMSADGEPNLDGRTATVAYEKYQPPSITDIYEGPWNLVDSAWIGAEDLAPSTLTSYPAIAVDGSGDVVVGFSAFGPGVYGGAYYAVHRSIDPAGLFSRSGTIQTGLVPFTFEGGDWGDYRVAMAAHKIPYYNVDVLLPLSAHVCYRSR